MHPWKSFKDAEFLHHSFIVVLICIGNHLNRTTWSSIWKYLSPRKCFSSKVSKFSWKLHEPVGGMRFEIFEKHTSANKIQIEREKSYHYFLIIFIEKFTCLALFQPVWTARHSCSAIASKSCFDELNCLSPIKELVYPFSFQYLSKAVIMTLRLLGYSHPLVRYYYSWILA